MASNLFLRIDYSGHSRYGNQVSSPAGAPMELTPWRANGFNPKLVHSTFGAIAIAIGISHAGNSGYF